MSGEAEMVQIIGGVAGSTGVITWLVVTKLIPALTNGKPKHSMPCAPLQVIQNKVENEEKTNQKQWEKIESHGRTLSRIDRTTSRIAGALKVDTSDIVDQD